jgi:hypothetical protein
LVAGRVKSSSRPNPQSDAQNSQRQAGWLWPWRGCGKPGPKQSRGEMVQNFVLHRDFTLLIHQAPNLSRTASESSAFVVEYFALRDWRVPMFYQHAASEASTIDTINSAQYQPMEISTQPVSILPHPNPFPPCNEEIIYMHFSGNLLCQRHCFWCLGDLNGLLTTQTHYQLMICYHISCEHFADFDLIDILQHDHMLSVYILKSIENDLTTASLNFLHSILS